MAPKQIYEIIWEARCLEFAFGVTHWKVFDSEDGARAYGRRKQDEWNDGLPPCEKADDGYYYRLIDAYPVHEVDGYKILLIDADNEVIDASHGLTRMEVIGG